MMKMKMAAIAHTNSKTDEVHNNDNVSSSYNDDSEGSGEKE